MQTSSKKNPWLNPIELTRGSGKSLTHGLRHRLSDLSQFANMRDFTVSNLYHELKPELDAVLSGHEYGFYADLVPKPKSFYRAVFWNLSGQVNYDCLLDVLKKHPILSNVDFFFFTNADIGMGRTENRNLMRSLALGLSYNYVFTCSHLYLLPHPQLPGVENEYGIVGQAILTRHQLTHFHTVALDPPVDPLRRAVKRIGNEKALIARVATPGSEELYLVCAKLDTASSPNQRAKQLRMIFDGSGGVTFDCPVLFGGGLNTTTYNSRHAVPQFFSFLNKIVRGYDYICDEHHAYPERAFEKKVFDELRHLGFHFENLNESGAPTFHCPFEELEVQGNKEKKVSHMMVDTLKRYFYHGPDRLALKVDWFAASKHIKPSARPQAERPRVLSNLYHDKAQISTHDPIVVDFELV